MINLMRTSLKGKPQKNLPSHHPQICFWVCLLNIFIWYIYEGSIGRWLRAWLWVGLMYLPFGQMASRKSKKLSNIGAPALPTNSEYDSESVVLVGFIPKASQSFSFIWLPFDSEMLYDETSLLCFILIFWFRASTFSVFFVFVVSPFLWSAFGPLLPCRQWASWA